MNTRVENLINGYIADQESPASKASVRFSVGRIVAALAIARERLPFDRHFDLNAYARIRDALVRFRNPWTKKAHSLATINLTLLHVRGVMRRAWANGDLDLDWPKLSVGMKRVRGTSERAGRSLTRAEVVALLKRCDEYPQPKGEILRAIVSVGVGTGLRRAELAGLTLKSLRSEEDAITEVRVRGKGNKALRCPLDEDTAVAVGRWLHVRATSSGWKHPYLFGSFNGKSPLSPNRLSQLVRTLGLNAGLTDALTTHDLRRTFATRMLDGGLPLTVVQRLMHHESVETTARYDRRGDDDLDRARRQVKALT